MIFFYIVLFTSIAVYIDAKRIGVRKGLIEGMANNNPWVWALGCLALWIIVFPYYLIKRDDFKKAIAIANGDMPLASKPVDLSEIEQLAELVDKGVLTQQEFEAQKKRILNN